MSGASVSLQGIGKRFGRVAAVSDVDLEIAAGEFCVLVGPSGCGKSTLLRLIAGLEDIDAGTLAIDGQRMNDTAPAARGVAMVFQSYALYPHMTVYRNMAFGLKVARHGADTVDQRVREAARMLQIDDLLDRRPRELSGGQRQRVAIGRAIVRQPRLFLFDEPLSNLDAGLRVQMRLEIARLHERLGTTIVYVTHDQIEAMTLADKIAVLNGGRIEQVGAPLELYHRPSNLFVAGFIGSPRMNLLPAAVTDRGAGAVELAVGSARLRLPGAAPLRAGDRVTLGIRPDQVRPMPEQPDLDLQVELIEELGDARLVHGTVGGDQSFTWRQADGQAPARGDHVGLALAPGAALLFDAAGQRVATDEGR